MDGDGAGDLVGLGPFAFRVSAVVFCERGEKGGRQRERERERETTISQRVPVATDIETLNEDRPQKAGGLLANK